MTTTIRILTSKLRSMRRMTQGMLAECAHLSKTTISNLESGHQTRIALDTIAKLCQALECTPSDLFEFTDLEQDKLIKLQNEALANFIGKLEYSVGFEPSKLDSDLAKITNARKQGHKH